MSLMHELNRRRIAQLSERSWIYRHAWKRLEPTVGMIDTDQGWVIIDGGNSPAHGRQVFEAAQWIKERPVRYVINTHRHFDHVFGNQAFDAPVIASRRCHERFSQNLREDWGPQRVQRWLHETMFRRVESLDPADFQGLSLVAPSLGFTGDLTLELGASEIELFPLSGVHSDDHIGVYLPQDQVLFLGDALYFLEGPEGRFLKLMELLDRLSRLKVRVFVAGHESPYGPDTFEALRAYCRELIRLLEPLVRWGASEDEVLAAVPFERRYERTSFLTAKLHRRLVRAAYRELSGAQGEKL